MSDLKHYQRLGAATLKADNAARAVRLLQVMEIKHASNKYCKVQIEQSKR
jgi:hypothetical protein